MDSSGFDLGIYSTDHVKEVIISCTFFLLFFVAQSIDFNSVLIDFGVVEAVLSKGKMIFVYLFGYFLFIIKFFLAFLFFSILVIVIVILFTSFFGVISINMKREFGKVDPGSTVGEKVAQVVDNNTNPLFNKVRQSIVWIGRYLASFISIKQFMSIYLVAIPIFLAFLYIFYALMIYKPEVVDNMDDTKKTKAMRTNHMYLFFIFVSIAIMAFIYLLYNYAAMIE